ncbi:MAG: OmpA family protein [Christensenellales bacterium]|jgi:chemotaxis protein MotB
MRYPRRSASRAAQGSSKQDFWLSFSDLMSVMVLVFILVLFYILYQYFIIQAAYEQELDNMLLIQAVLSEKETALTSAQDTLESQQRELTDAEKELAKQQVLLNLAQQAMADSELELSEKQSQLDAALSLLEEREGALASLQTELGEKQSQLEGQQAQLEALVGVRSRIIQTLSHTLKESQISATVDPVSGAIMLESDVLFAYGSADLTDAGREYIDRFLPAYLSVIFSAENSAYVSEIIIEGHTDSTDTYIKNLRLSQNRAYAVAEYVLDSNYANLTGEQKARLESLLTANGRSYSDPIYDAQGHEDDAASRRVAFKFRLTDEQMIEQMREILEGAGDEG